MSRLGVYEWNRDEFAPLETPQFAIPCAKPEPAYSWMDAIRGLIFTPARLSFAGGALALLVAALGWVYVADVNSVAVADNQVEPVIELPRPENTLGIAKTVDESAKDNYSTDKVLVERPVASKTAPPNGERKPAAVRAKIVKEPASRQLNARGNRPANVPRLGTFEEVEDTSLRLADLVANIDSYRK
jgi:hypothetical protein